MTDDTVQAAPEAAPTPASFVLRSQYIKDLSFENPRAPGVFASMTEAPQIDVNVNMQAARLQQNIFELTIQIAVRALHEKTTVFLVDLSYAGIFEANNIPEDHLEQAIMVQGAFLIFPYARRIISDVTRDGGFPPLNLEPIDFFAMHANQKRQQA